MTEEASKEIGRIAGTLTELRHRLDDFLTTDEGELTINEELSVNSATEDLNDAEESLFKAQEGRKP